MKLPTLKTAMTPFPYSVDLDASLKEAQQLMDEHDVHHLPVTQGHGLVGVVTGRGILSALAARPKREHGKLTVKDVYETDVYVVDLNEPIENVLLTMADRHIGSAIVTRLGRLAGVFTWVDACRAFGEYIRENFPRPDDNDAAERMNGHRVKRTATPPL